MNLGHLMQNLGSYLLKLHYLGYKHLYFSIKIEMGTYVNRHLSVQLQHPSLKSGERSALKKFELNFLPT